MWWQLCTCILSSQSLLFSPSKPRTLASNSCVVTHLTSVKPLGILILEMLTVPFSIFSTTSQGKWTKSNSCPAVIVKMREQTVAFHDTFSNRKHLPPVATPARHWSEDGRGKARAMSKGTQVCFSGMIHSELVYFLHLFDEDKVFKGWSNVLGFLVFYSFEQIVTA